MKKKITPKTKQSVETWLPVFSGFYSNSYWEENLDNEAEYFEDEYGYKGEQGYDGELWRFFDYKKWQDDIVKSFCDVLTEKLSEFVKSIIFQKVVSPREYNFTNDAGDVIIIANIKAIRDYIYANRSAYEKYLEDTYTGYDGFIPSYHNFFEAWVNYTHDFTDYSDNGHYLGSVLQFIASQHELTEGELYEQVKEGIYESEYFKDELYDKCNEIRTFVQQHYSDPNRLTLLHENFDSAEFDFETIIGKVDKEIEDLSLKIQFKDGKK